VKFSLMGVGFPFKTNIPVGLIGIKIPKCPEKPFQHVKEVKG
jgi:hypothetical protein